MAHRGVLSWLIGATVPSLNGGPLAGLRQGHHNGEFEVWPGGTSFTGITTTATYTAEGWRVATGAGTLGTVQRVANGRTGARTRYGLQIAGDTGVTTIDADQRIEASRVPAFKRQVTFSAYIRNDSGAAFTPSLLLGTPGAADDFTTVTNRLTQTLQSCADAAYTLVQHTVDISGYTNIDNGLQVTYRAPSGAVVASDTWGLFEPQIMEGSVVTPFEALPKGLVFTLCRRYFRSSFPDGTKPADNVINTGVLTGVLTATTNMEARIQWSDPMRAAPTFTAYCGTDSVSAGQWSYYNGSGFVAGTSTTFARQSVYGGICSFTTGILALAASYQTFGEWSASARL